MKKYVVNIYDVMECRLFFGSLDSVICIYLQHFFMFDHPYMIDKMNYSDYNVLIQ